ncbi:MAG: glycosyltransferase [Spirochaetota bacterium]
MPKILYIGFGIEPYCIGGAVLYQDALIRAVNAEGWETVCFYAAPQYTYKPTLDPFIKTWYKDKIKFIELYNTPHRFGYLNNPEHESSYKSINKFTEDILDQEKPDIVHIHELQLHSVSIIDLIVKRKIPVIKTMHNYYDICSQRDLMYLGKERCIDYNNGEECVKCLNDLPRYKYYSYYLNSPLLTKIKFMLLKRIANCTQKLINPLIPYSSNQYLNRRKYFIERLNKLTVIHCSAQGAANIFINHGILPELMKIIPIASATVDLIFPKPVHNKTYPVVFGYVGGLYHHKGYDVLIDAFAKLDQNKAKLIIWHDNNKKIIKGNLNIEYKTHYNNASINEAFKEIDVGIVPSIWDEIFGLIGIEWIKAKIPVIGSNIGGIPQWLSDQENGFLVKPNDVNDLSEKMEKFIKHPELVSDFQNKIKNQQTFKEHIYSMLELYNNLLLKK